MKLFKLSHVTLFAALFAHSTSYAAEDDEIDYVGTMSIGNKTMLLIVRDREFRPTFTTLSMGLTGLYKRYYVTFEHERSIQDAIEANNNGLVFFSRKDTSLTFGYSLASNLSIFTGYREGETTDYYTAQPPGSFTSFGTESSGIFLGGSYSYSNKRYGTFGASLAIAQLTGSISLVEPFVETGQFNPAFPPPDSVDGDAVGYSFGLSWSGELSDATLYNAAFKIHRYEFEDDRRFGGIDLSFIEDFNTFSLGLTHFF